MQKHIVKLPKRTGECRVTERPDRILLELSFSEYGDLGDLAEVKAWLGSIFEKYEGDARPVYMPNPTTGELAILP